MIYLHFIVNPISGKGKHNITKDTLENYFPIEQYRIEIDYSKYKKNAIELTQKAVKNNPDCIIACGGDGTINEVASCLVNTNIKLGIIPVGSGNGLASNLNIPKQIEKAIEIIKKEQSLSIDVGKVNEHYFFSNMGIGIDALVIKKYEEFKKRTLIAYIRASLLASFQHRPQKTILAYNNQITNQTPFMLFISNSNEMGYNMSLTPQASLSDGWLDLVLIPKLNFLEKLKLGMSILLNKINQFKKAKHSLIQNIDIELPEKIFLDAQIDGEYHYFKTNKLQVTILKGALEVLVNK